MPARPAALPLAAALVLMSTGPALAQAIQGPPKPPSKPPASQVAKRAGPSQEAVKAAKLFEQAVAHQRAGKVEEAVAEYRALLKIAPGAYPAYINLGLIYQARHDDKSAEAAFKQAARLEPKNAVPPTQLALLYLSQQRAQEAKAQADRAVALDPKSAQAHFARGGCFVALKKPQLAEPEYREAVRLAPQNAQARINLGYVLANQHHYEAARAAFEKAVELEPKNAQAWLYLGVIRQGLKQYHVGIAAYRRAAELDPTAGAPWYNIGGSYQLLAQEAKGAEVAADKQEALSAYLKSIERAPKYAPARTSAGRLYFEIGNYREAARYFQSAAALEPKDGRLLANAAVAETYEAAQERDPKQKVALESRAEEHFQKALVLTPHPMVYQGLGSLYEQEGRRERADDVYRQWAAKLPKDPEPLLRLGRSLEAQGKVAEAVPVYQKAVALEGNDAKDLRARLALASAYQNSRPPRLDDAATLYRQIVAADPKNAEAHRLLGQLYLRQPEHAKEAEAEFQTLKRLASKESSAYVALATLYEKQGRIDDAAREYRSLAAQNPMDISARWYAAQLFERHKRYLDAVAEYREIEKIAPNDTTQAVNVGRLLEMAGKPDEAAAEYKRLRAKDPRNLQVAMLYAGSLETAGKHEEAIHEYESIVDGFANAASAWLQIGDVYRGMGRLADARSAYLRLIDRPIEGPQAYDRLEATFDTTKQPGDWIAFLKDRLTRKSADRLALARLEAAETKAGHADDLLAFLKSLTAKQTADPSVLRAYADALRRAGKGDEALAVEREAVKADPTDYATRLNIAAQFEAAGRIPEAIELYEEVAAIKTVPAAQLTETRLKLAALYEKNGQRNEALAQYREALKAEPTNAVAAAAVKRLGG